MRFQQSRLRQLLQNLGQQLRRDTVRIGNVLRAQGRCLRMLSQILQSHQPVIGLFGKLQHNMRLLQSVFSIRPFMSPFKSNAQFLKDLPFLWLEAARAPQTDTVAPTMSFSRYGKSIDPGNSAEDARANKTGGQFNPAPWLIGS